MTRVFGELRERVVARAAGLCEYCRLDEQYTIKRHEVDHIYAEKHGGVTEESNLCLSCFDCNRYKGSDLCSLDPQSGELAALYHPRGDTWAEHFRLNGAVIEGISPQGRVTVRLLHLNDRGRLDERDLLIRLARYPSV